jgi:hypothetical protein
MFASSHKTSLLQVTLMNTFRAAIVSDKILLFASSHKTSVLQVTLMNTFTAAIVYDKIQLNNFSISFPSSSSMISNTTYQVATHIKFHLYNPNMNSIEKWFTRNIKYKHIPD